MAGLLFFLGSKLYLRGVYLVSSVGKAEKKEDVVSDAAYAKKSIHKAYFLKECKILYRTPAYRKYCVMVNIIWPVLAVALFVLPATKNFMTSFENLLSKGFVASDLIALLLVLIVSFFATAMNSIASTSFTREGEHFSFIKYVPVSYRTQIGIKAGVSLVYSGITVIITIIVLCVCMHISVPTAIYFIIIALLSVMCCTYIGLWLDATHPKLNWEDEYGALRGNLNAFFNMAIAILVSMILCGIGFCLFKFTRMDSFMIFAIYLVILGLVTYRIRRNAIIYIKKSISNDLYV